MPLLLCCTILVALNLRTDKLFLVPPAGFEPAIYTLKGCCPGPLDDGGQLRALLYQGSAILPTALRRTAHPRTGRVAATARRERSRPARGYPRAAQEYLCGGREYLCAAQDYLCGGREYLCVAQDYLRGR